MWQSKKFIIIAVAIALVLVGSLAGVTLAQTGGTSGNSGQTLMSRVANILGIDQQTLEDAFTQAQKEMRDEALDAYLQKLVDDGTITREQADQYKEWLQSKPDLEPYRQQLQQWQQNRPDVPLPGKPGGHAFRGGMRGGQGPFFRGM